MPTIANLGNGVGFVYITEADGTTVVSATPNTAANVFGIILKAKIYKGVANHADQAGLNENNYRCFLNDDSLADEDSLGGSIEITDWLVARGFEGEFPRVGSFVFNTDNEIVIPRKGSMQFVFVRQDTGVEEVRNILPSDKFVAGDIVVLRNNTALGAGASISPVIVKDGVGNIRLTGGDFILNNDIAEGYTHIMLRFDGTVWHEVFRNPTSGIPTVQGARANGFSVNGDTHLSSLVTSGGGVVINPNTNGRYITLVSPFPVTLTGNFDVTASEAKAGDFYFVRIQALYTLGGGDIRLFGTPITGTVIPANTSFNNPANVVCLYTGSSWQFFCVVDINRYNLDLDTLRVRRYAKVTYDFAIQTGATGTYTIGNNAIPANSVIDLQDAIIVTKTALTSGGAAAVAIGLNSDDDAVDGFRAFSAAPYNAVNASTKANTTVASRSIFVSAAADITFTISTSNLTAGKVDIYVPYTAG
jgi:hypothetical protein